MANYILNNVYLLAYMSEDVILNEIINLTELLNIL